MHSHAQPTDVFFVHVLRYDSAILWPGKMTGLGGCMANNSRDGMRWVMSHEYARSGHISCPVAGILEHLERGGGPGRLDHLILCSFWGSFFNRTRARWIRYAEVF